MTEAKERLVPTGSKEIEKVKRAADGEVVELPSFVDGTPFVAKLRRPSIYQMAKLGKIPNPLSAALDELMSGALVSKAPVRERAEVLGIVAQAALVEPAYDEVEDILDSYQLMAIWEYVMNGVGALKPFRDLRNVFVAGADRRAVERAAEQAD
jgi:hypothetical protein